MDIALLTLSAFSMVVGGGGSYLAMKSFETDVTVWMWTLFGISFGISAVLLLVGGWFAVVQYRKGHCVRSMLCSALPLLGVALSQVLVAKIA